MRWFYVSMPSYLGAWVTGTILQRQMNDRCTGTPGIAFALLHASFWDIVQGLQYEQAYGLVFRLLSLLCCRSPLFNGYACERRAATLAPQSNLQLGFAKARKIN